MNDNMQVAALFQQETRRTSALMQMVQEAAALLRAQEAWHRATQVQAFLDKADRLRTDVTDEVLGLAPATEPTDHVERPL